MQIEGTITYKVNQDENGISLSYESTLENDIAAMAIAEYVCNEWITLMKEEKANHKGKVKTQINDRINKTLQVQSGLKTLTDYSFAMYAQFKKMEEMKSSADVQEENDDPKTERLPDVNEIKLEPLQGSNEIN